MKGKLFQRLLLISFGIILSFIAVTAQAVIPNQPVVNKAPTSPGEHSLSEISQQLIGTWELSSYESRNSQGEIVNDSPWYYNRGLLMYDEAGRMAVQLVNDARPGGLKGDIVEAVSKATPEELKKDILGYLAYFGTYTIEPKKHTIYHHVEASTNNYLGTIQARSFEIAGNQLILMKSAFPAQGSSPQQLSSRIVWERIK